LIHDPKRCFTSETLEAVSSYTIPSVDRSFELLEWLAVSERGLSLAELTRQTGFPKSTVFRILATLEERQVVVLDAHTRTYTLGHRLWMLGYHYLERSDLYQAAAPVMQRLAEASGETVFLGKLEDGEVIYMRRIESPRSVAIVKKLGQRVPAHCTATGTAILAFLPAQQVAGILDAHGLDPYNDATITDPDAFRRRLDETRSRGFALVDGEYNRELMCISAPVFDHTAAPRASLTVAMPAAQKPGPSRQAEIGRLVRAAALDLSHQIGYIGRA
jgi:DNA-binding IclR family transcriptional regulator